MSQTTKPFIGEQYAIVIKDQQTGESRLYTPGVEIKWEDSSRYWWMEGNMGCDCNRASAFDQGVAIDNPDEPCGSHRYTIEAFVFKPGAPEETTIRPEELQ